MRPCIIIKGDYENLEKFENKIALALGQGYEISGDLITHVINFDGRDIIILLQPMFLSDEEYHEADSF